MSQARSRGTSQRRRSFQHGMLDRLEERTLLSADLGPGAAMMLWGRGEVPVIAGSYVVTFDNYLGNAQAELMAREVATRLGVNATDFQSLGRGGWATFKTNDFVNEDMARRAAAAVPGVKAVEPNTIEQTARVPNDPRLNEQYSLINTGQVIPLQGGLPGTLGADIHAAQAWDTTIGSRDVIIAVIDTGVDYTHPDLERNIWVNPGEIAGDGIDNDGNGFVDDVHGFDFGEQDADPMDREGHGTMCSGVIGAVGDNGQGISGVAWAVQIMGLKIADAFGRLSTAAIIGAHDYATMMRQRGTNVVASNNSYGAFAPAFYENQAGGFADEKSAIQRWIDAGGIFVAAAGNDGFDNDSTFTHFPASYNIPGIIAVAASDNNDGLAGFSDYGARTVDLAAPGVNVLTTTIGGGYEYVDGTSFSSPTVAGAVALIKTIAPSASAVQVRQALIDSADQLPAFQGKTVSGGRLNVARALQIVNIDGPVLRGVSPGPVTTQLDPATNQAISTISMSFNKVIDNNSSFFNAAGLSLIGLGTDGLQGTADDVTVPVASVSRYTNANDPNDPINNKRADAVLNLTSFPLQRLPLGTYVLTVSPDAIRDLQGNRLNGNASSGTAATYSFRVVAASGDNEPNDSFGQATAVSFDATGSARFSGATIGNGLFANLDVDLYKVTLARGGLITAEVFAQRRTSPSSLDSVLRLFNARGEELATNDQFFGSDSYLDFFVSTGGVYYVGVSGFGNARYDPNVPGSGSSQSTGAYDIALGAQLVTDDVVSVAASGQQINRRIPLASGATQGTTSSQVLVTDSRQIQDVNVHVSITHTFVSDLQISLIAPWGSEIQLFNRRGANGQNLTSTTFDDEGTAAIASGSAPFSGVYRPEQALGAFDGHAANGTWTLVIRDQVALNAGNLDNWSLEFTFTNDIFGPFEFNDTLPTAKALTEIAGFGTATRAAFVGDGGFGNLDRDLFKITVDAGTSLAVSLTSGGQLNSALRLFSETGVQLLISSPAAGNNAAIQNYVFTAGGIYYVGVSESANTSYDPLVAGSGVSSATTGNYTLVVTVAKGVSDPALVLVGSPLTVGINPSGTFSGTDTSGTNAGLQFGAVDFLPTTSNGAAPRAFIGAVADGSTFSNVSGAGVSAVPFALVDRSDADHYTVSAFGQFGSLRIERVISFGKTDNYVAIDVYLTNTGTSAIASLGWMEGFNPDPGVSDRDANTSTANDVVGRSAFAVYTTTSHQSGLTIALVAPESDTRAKATIVSSTEAIRDPSQLIAQASNDPGGTVSDGQLALSFNIGALATGATTRVRYFVMMSENVSVVQATRAALNAGTGTGNLTAAISTSGSGAIVVDSSTPTTEALDTGSGAAATAPTLPYRLYYPEGFSGPGVSTLMRLSNPTAQATRVFAIAHFEFGDRDQVLADITLAPNSRAVTTLTTPATFGSTAILTRDRVPYSVEIRSERPVNATFEHSDTNLNGNSTSTLGEAFTSRTSSSWSFSNVQKGDGISDFLSYFNTTSTFTKVTATFYPAAGGSPISIPFNLAAFRRGGIALADIAALADGTYGVIVTADVPIVASQSDYRAIDRISEGTLGQVGAGVASGVSPEGQFGLNATSEIVSVLNTNSAQAQIVFSFQFANGASYRQQLLVPANSFRQLSVGTLPNFPAGQAYSILYESNIPVTVTAPANAFGGELWGAFADRSYSLWGVSNGFRPAGDTQTTTTEYLRVFNSANTATAVEITIAYTDGSTEIFRRTIDTRRVAEFNLDDFITGAHRQVDSFYSVQVKAASPVVVYSARIDRTAGLAYGSLATPQGTSGPVVQPLS